MATILERTSFVSSLFVTSGNVYQRSTDGTDPIYGEMRLSENVTVSGGKVVWNTNDSHATAGLVLDSFPTFDGSEGSIEATYTPNADVVLGGADELFYVPLIIIHNATTRVLVFEMYEDGGILRYNLRAKNFGIAGYTDIDTPTAGFTAGTPYRFKMAWKAGTPSGGPPFTSVAADGYVRWYLNDVLIDELTSQAVYIDASNDNEVTIVTLATDVLIGGGGLFGALGGYEFFSGPPADPAEIPINESTPCCGDGVTPSTGTGGVGATMPDNPFQPLQPWVSACAGGGTVPTAADLTDSESWA